MGLVWDLELEPSLKLVMLAYADHADHDGKNVYPAETSIANKTGLSRRTVVTCTQKLEKMGLLIRDGTWKNNVNKWLIPLDMGGQAVQQLHGLEDQAVQMTTSSCATVAHKPSLTIIKSELTKNVNSDVGKDPRPLSPKSKFISDLSRYFEEVAGIPWVEPKNKSDWADAQVKWLKPLNRIAVYSKWDLEKAKGLIIQALNRAAGQYTVSQPKSIENEVAAVVGEMARGQYKETTHTMTDDQFRAMLRARADGTDDNTLHAE